jgi:hypothetical protein
MRKKYFVGLVARDPKKEGKQPSINIVNTINSSTISHPNIQKFSTYGISHVSTCAHSC